MKAAGGTGILLEGIPGSGKSSVFEGLRQAKRVCSRPEPSRHYYSEHATQRVLELAAHRGEFGPRDHLAHLEGILDEIARKRESLLSRGFEPDGESGFLYILERFHLTHAAYYPYLDWDFLFPLDARLAEMGCRLCLLTVNARALEERIFRDRWPGWLDYVRRYGETRGGIIEHYLRQQDEYLHMAKMSAMECIVEDTSHCTPDDTLRAVLDSWIP